MHNQAKDLFMFQTTLIDHKVEISVSTAISQVVDQIINLRMEMHQEIGGLRQEMHNFKHEMGERLSAVETALGMRSQIHSELRTRFFDYTFRAGWAISLVTLSAAVSSLVMVLHSML